MIVLSGGQTVELSQDDFRMIVNNYDKVHIDIGTGDARNIYKLAKSDPKTLYIGIDPVKENMYEIAKKISKKPSKGGLTNVLLVIAAVEDLPFELNNIADSVSILFPWGSLLECVVKPNEKEMTNISNLVKDNAYFEFITTYSNSYEEGEIIRRDLPSISIEYFQSEQYVSTLYNLSFKITSVEEYDNEFVKQFHSQWAKKLAFGRKRSFFRIGGIVDKSKNLK